MGWGLVLLAYLLGCIPTGLIVAGACGVDLRSQGSGNLGATNALRVISKTAGAVTLAGDMLKGLLAVYLAMRFAGRETAIYAAAAAVIGHDFPVFMGFRGGKGVATSFGVLLGLAPVLALSGMAVWVGTVALSRISSLGALVSFTAIPVMAWLMHGPAGGTLLLTVFLAGLVFVRHRANIARLTRGEEPRLGSRGQGTKG